MRRSRCPALAAFLASAAFASSGPVQGQALPQPAEALVAAETLARFPAGTFLESVVVDAFGTLYVADHEEGVILRRAPAGEQREFARIAGSLTGLGLDAEGGLHATGVRRAGPRASTPSTRTGVRSAASPFRARSSSTA